MSDVFHKSCYTTRSSGYKYRTLATNTGDKKRRDAKEDSTVDSKFKEMRCAIAGRVQNHFNNSQKARESLFRKFEVIDAKINSMLALQTTVNLLRKDLTAVENVLADLHERVEKLDTTPSSTSTYLSYPARSCNAFSSTIGTTVMNLQMDSYQFIQEQGQMRAERRNFKKIYQAIYSVKYENDEISFLK